jgi:tripartite-type tricarboxylate transporter receptor subunit TctC
MKGKFIGCLAILLAFLSTATSTNASPYPEKPIRIIVPYTPGDGPDVIARLIGSYRICPRWARR